MCFSDLVPLVRSSLGPSMLLQMALLHSSWWLSNTANTFLRWLVLCAVPGFPARLRFSEQDPCLCRRLHLASSVSSHRLCHGGPWWTPTRREVSGPHPDTLAGWVGLSRCLTWGALRECSGFQHFSWASNPGSVVILRMFHFSKLCFFHLGKDMIYLIKLEWNLRYLFYM